ncbi:hypothetical protein BJ165DRAFT_1408873 [Panaeolus papilionaceus]|nr:hypothetical protein BJ165DRAFT_1408873 [Panaeolus papilionaceus]
MVKKPKSYVYGSSSQGWSMLVKKDSTGEVARARLEIRTVEGDITASAEGLAATDEILRQSGIKRDPFIVFDFVFRVVNDNALSTLELVQNGGRSVFTWYMDSDSDDSEKKRDRETAGLDDGSKSKRARVSASEERSTPSSVPAGSVSTPVAQAFAEARVVEVTTSAPAPSPTQPQIAAQPAADVQPGASVSKQAAAIFWPTAAGIQPAAASIQPATVVQPPVPVAHPSGQEASATTTNQSQSQNQHHPRVPTPNATSTPTTSTAAATASPNAPEETQIVQALRYLGDLSRRRNVLTGQVFRMIRSREVEVQALQEALNAFGTQAEAQGMDSGGTLGAQMVHTPHLPWATTTNQPPHSAGFVLDENGGSQNSCLVRRENVVSALDNLDELNINRVVRIVNRRVRISAERQRQGTRKLPFPLSVRASPVSLRKIGCDGLRAGLVGHPSRVNLMLHWEMGNCQWRSDRWHLHRLWKDRGEPERRVRGFRVEVKSRYECRMGECEGGEKAKSVPGEAGHRPMTVVKVCRLDWSFEFEFVGVSASETITERGVNLISKVTGFELVPFKQRQHALCQVMTQCTIVEERKNGRMTLVWAEESPDSVFFRTVELRLKFMRRA